MRVVLGLGLALSMLLAAPAHASCSSACNTQHAGCKKRCGTQPKKEQGDCLNTCEEQARMCPQMCEIGKRNKGDPAATKREAKAAFLRAQQAKQQQGEGH